MGMNMKKNSGFTLIELLIALTLFAIMIAVGVPMINQVTNSNRMVADLNHMAGALALARSESVKRGRIITVCASTTPMASGALCDTNNWEQGWVIFMDVDKDNEMDPADGDILLKIGEALLAGNTMRLYKSDNAGVLQFKPDGTVRDRNFDGSDDGTFVICEKTKDTKLARGIHVNRLGRTSRAEDNGTTPTDNTLDKIVDDIEGFSVSCPA
jgi:type IV fimbrial biogenesis protein FimT